MLLSLTLPITAFSEEVILYDKDRGRHIPIEVNLPQNTEHCSKRQKCPLAFISSGYGVKHNDYAFITQVLNKLGYLVVSIQHELENDPPLSRTSPFIKTRYENWQRGAVTLSFVRDALSSQLDTYDFDKLTLVGHSNGGDISALFSNQHDAMVETLITLDHRRFPLPRSRTINVLTIRASDFPADDGVLLTSEELAEFGDREVKIEKARHNDMTDYGPEWLKQKVVSVIHDYLVTSLLK
jgi:hypothetical protein